MKKKHNVDSSYLEPLKNLLLWASMDLNSLLIIVFKMVYLSLHMDTELLFWLRKQKFSIMINKS